MTNTTNTFSTRNTRFGRKEFFGCASRYAVQSQTMTLCGEEVTMWVVTDALQFDVIVDLPAIIRQEYTREAAIKGLDDCDCGFCSGEWFVN